MRSLSLARFRICCGQRVCLRDHRAPDRRVDAMSGLERRKSGRVELDSAFLVYLIAIDGLLMRDVADSGAKLTVRLSWLGSTVTRLA